MARSVLLRPLPFADPDRLVMLYGQNDLKDPSSANVVAAGDFYEWQKASRGFEQMAIWRWSGYNPSGNGNELPEMVSAAYGSWNLFPTLGVQPCAGAFVYGGGRPPRGESYGDFELEPVQAAV